MSNYDINGIEGSILHLKTEIPKKRPLLIAFGGMENNKCPTPFSFVSLSLPFVNVEKIYLRDTNAIWYHLGLDGESENIKDTATFLRAKIQEINPSKVIAVGNSMGGYAAILFGSLINVDIIHAFAPNTVLSNEVIYSEKQLAKLYKNFNNTYFDLNKILQSTNYDSEINLYFDRNYDKDANHAYNIKNNKNVTLYPYEEGSHNLVHKLNDSGELKQIIFESF
ncbi:MAG: hypothetical protein GY816_21755 [Cytophagales bacterium]|nr:hypothetical protein [Cytophagales bacterium]